MKVIDNKYMQLFAVVALCLIIEYLCFGSIMLGPNNETFAFGGDALFLYYNITYHACYGSGMMLESMNYPFGESIFMTDAQGALSITLTALRSLGIDTCTYGVGIVNGLIIYLLPLCAVFVHLILRRFGINSIFSIIVSVAIALMAPQVFRMGSHYGLSYPFYIPMCIYWIIRKFDLQRWEWKDILFITVAAFFYLNNPYVGFAGLLFIPIVSLIKVFKTTTFKSFYLQYFGVTASIILFGYALIKLTDPYINRIKEQNGFFFYNIDIRGLINSPYGFTNKLISRFHSVPPSGIESTINYGILPLIAFVLVLYFAVKSRKVKFNVPTESFKYVIIGGVLLTLVACNGIIPRSIQELITTYLRPLLLFKATGRFIWLSYFVIALWTAWWLYQLIQKVESRYLRLGLFTIVALLWIWEASFGLNKYANKLTRGSNMFNRAVGWTKYLKDNNVDPEEYQAILALPIMQGWSSKLSTPLTWRSQYESTTMAVTTGLPIIDGMLSRMSLDHAMNIVQLASDPLIGKDLIDKLPDDRPILVMDMSEKNPLPGNQGYILTRSTPLTKYKHFDMYRLELDSLRIQPTVDSVLSRYKSKEYNVALHYEGFDKNNNDKAYRYQPGSLDLHSGVKQNLYSIDITGLKDSTTIEVSFWTLYTPLHEATPKFNIQSIDSTDKVIEDIYVDSRKSRNVKNNWVQVKALLKTSKKIHSIKVLSTSKKDELIDDLLIRYIDEDVVIDRPNDNYFLWNNHLVKQ